MEKWDPVKDREALLIFKKSVDSDNIRVKEVIKKVLLNNRFIIHVLNNKELEESDAEPDDYFGENIRPYYMIPETQGDVQNFICYEVSYKDMDRYNHAVKQLQVIFYILCERKNLIDGDTGVARHDLLAALIQNDFNYTNYFGAKLQLISDIPSVTDTDYASRTLIFEQTTDNNLVKTSKDTKVPRLANKEVWTIG